MIKTTNASESIATRPDDWVKHVPETYWRSLRRAIEILKTAGCTDVFLFGSVAGGHIRDDSDIDLAIRGCPRGEFFHVLGQLLLELDHPIDLVNLDSQDAFARYLEQEGDLVRVG
jgi:predicted nucleotidyltransferase